MQLVRRKIVAIAVAFLVALTGVILVGSCEEQNHGYHYPAGE